MPERGYFTIGRFHGARVRLHWSTVAGMLVLTRFHVAPGAWLGFLLVVLVHELGHALLAQRMGMEVVTVTASAASARTPGSPPRGEEVR